MEGNAVETVIVLNKNARWAEVILQNKAHFIVSFPASHLFPEVGQIGVNIRRICKGVIITKGKIMTLEIGKNLDFPFIEPYKPYTQGEPPVDVYVEVTKDFVKKITFTYYNEDSQN